MTARKIGAATLAVLAACATLGVALGETATPPVGRGDRYAGAPWATQAPVVAQHGMAATENPLATQIALDILKKGGSAMDAAIAANAALGLMQPVLDGIGGDCFVIVWDPKTKQLYGYNGSGAAPMGRDLQRLKAEIAAAYKKAGQPYAAHIPPVGVLPITVPGAVDAWFALHDRFGKLAMKDVLAPAIGYARDGFPVAQLAAQYWKGNMASFQSDKRRGFFSEFDNAKKTYLIADADGGHTPAQGEIFKNPDLARTYSLLAEGGRDAFYKGEIAHTMDAYFKRVGGDLRYADFAAHHGEWVTPLSVNYRGYDVYELPPNGQGFAALQMLQVLKGFDLKKSGWGTPDTLTAMVESKRLAFEDLAKWYADPKFAKLPIKGLLSEKYAEARRQLIAADHATADIGPGDPKLYDGDTTYLTVADDSGMMVSLIQSNYRGMGSGVVADGLGFMFQDRGELYSLDSKAANGYAPGKRPFHTIIPAFVLKDGAPFMAFGLMGGDMQPQGHVQILSNIIDFGMNVQEAGDAARWRHSGNAEPTGEKAEGIGTLELESGYSAATKAELAKRGYKIAPGTGNFGGYQAILWDAKSKVYWGATEMRKDGRAAGY